MGVDSSITAWLLVLGSCPFYVVTKRQLGQGIPTMAVSPLPFPLSFSSLPHFRGLWNGSQKEARADAFSPPSQIQVVFHFSSQWILLALRNCGAASLVPIQPGVGFPPFPALKLLWEETARAGGHQRATPCPVPGEGWALHSQECFAAGFLLSEPYECVCLLGSKLKKEKKKKKITNI